MINHLFSIPLYLKEKAFLPSETEQINKCFMDLKEQERLTTFNGSAKLSFNTPLISILDDYDLLNIKEKIKRYCKLYITGLNHRVKEIELTQDWVIGYTKNDHQGEHSHGNHDFSISGIIYTKVPANSSPVIFATPNPYATHICAANTHSTAYVPSEGMLILFPSCLKHSVPINKNLLETDLRICLSFNAMVLQ